MFLLYYSWPNESWVLCMVIKKLEPENKSNFPKISLQNSFSMSGVRVNSLTVSREINLSAVVGRVLQTSGLLRIWKITNAVATSSSGYILKTLFKNGLRVFSLFGGFVLVCWVCLKKICSLVLRKSSVESKLNNLSSRRKWISSFPFLRGLETYKNEVGGHWELPFLTFISWKGKAEAPTISKGFTV